MKKIFSLFLFSVIFISKNFAQENLPYSRYGIGFLQPMQFQSTMGMGNLGTTFQSEWMQNPANPASYASIAPKTTLFDAALQMRWNTLSDANNNTSFFDMQPAYVGLASKIKSTKKLQIGIGINLMPYSKLSYNIEQKANGLDSAEKYAFSGSGNTYKFQIGTGVKYKNLFFGLQGGYMFGKNLNNAQIYFPDSIHSMGVEHYTYQYVGGFCWQAGLQYVVPLKKESKLIFGATYVAGNLLNTHQTEVWRRFASYQGAYGYVIDTLKNVADTTGKIKIPSAFSVGVQFVQGRQWAFGAEFSTQDWSLFRNFEHTDSLRKSWKLSVGGYFTPDPLSKQVFKRCIYKVGFNYGLDPIYLRGTQFNYYSFTGGITVPFTIKAEENRPVLVFMHLNFESGTHSSSNTNLISENFFRFNFGITVSGNWYQKRKFE